MPGWELEFRDVVRHDLHCKKTYEILTTYIISIGEYQVKEINNESQTVHLYSIIL